MTYVRHDAGKGLLLLRYRIRVRNRAEMTGVGLIAFGVPRLGHSRLNKDPFERPQRRKCARIAACVGMVVGRVFAHNRRTRTRQLHDVKI